MGINAEIRMDPPPTPEAYPALLMKFWADWPEEPPGGHQYPNLEPTGVVVQLWRYYDSHHRRGPWPEIRRMIEWLWANTESQVRYGSDADHTDEPPIITPEDVERIQAAYDAHDGDR